LAANQLDRGRALSPTKQSAGGYPIPKFCPPGFVEQLRDCSAPTKWLPLCAQAWGDGEDNFGPFAGTFAIVDRGGADRVRLFLDLLGRRVPVEVSVADDIELAAVA
jgi:hypothetical protein